jgi:hypothetical protein
MNEGGRIKIYLVSILDRKFMRKKVVVVGLIWWSNSFPEDAT